MKKLFIVLLFLLSTLIPVYASDNNTDTELRVYDANTGAAVSASTIKMTLILSVKGSLVDSNSSFTPTTVNLSSVTAQDFTGANIPIAFSNAIIPMPVPISQFEESGETIINLGTVTIQGTPKNGFILNIVAQTDVNYGNPIWRARKIIDFNAQLPTTFAKWVSKSFTAAQQANPAVSGAMANPANDGIPNIFKYAFNLSPFTYYSKAYQARLVNNHFVFTFRQNIMATDLTFQIGVKTSLTSPWAFTTLNAPSSQDSFSFATPQYIDSSTQTDTATDKTNMTQVHQRFFELRINRAGVGPYVVGLASVGSINTPIVTLTNSTALPGTAVTLTANASGSSAPLTYQWQVSTDNGRNFSPINGETSAAYAFKAAMAFNGNQYECVVTNIAGSSTSNVVTLSVQKFIKSTPISSALSQ